VRLPWLFYLGGSPLLVLKTEVRYRLLPPARITLEEIKMWQEWWMKLLAQLDLPAPWKRSFKGGGRFDSNYFTLCVARFFVVVLILLVVYLFVGGQLFACLGFSSASVGTSLIPVESRIESRIGYESSES